MSGPSFPKLWPHALLFDPAVNEDGENGYWLGIIRFKEYLRHLSAFATD